MTFSGSGWKTALDLDFTLQSNQTLNSNTTYTIGGVTWTKFNSANDATAMAVTSGSGLVMIPGSTSDYNAGTYTFPGIQLPLTQIFSSSTLDGGMGLRVWTYVIAGNFTANYDNFILAVGNGSATYGACVKYGFGTGGQGSQSFWNVASSNLGFQNDSYTVTSNNKPIQVLEIPKLSGGQFQVASGSTYNNGFPAPNDSTLNWLTYGQDTGARHDFGQASLLNNLNVILGAQRAASVTSLTVRVARIRIDYRL